ncbi:MAG: cytochrome c-type biogenesis protein CcmH [Magnetococcales bacterium]|nr:cytochrome c-type biogenesis protein CcmH [Magnetococcales bacterium]
MSAHHHGSRGNAPGGVRGHAPLARLLLLLSFTLLFTLPPGTVRAEVRGEDPTEAMVRQIAKDLRCAVCQNQSVYESNSDLAKDMLSVIRQKVAAGEPEANIRDYFFQRYGDYIYLEPTTTGMNSLLWGAPFAGLALGGVALWLAMRQWRKKNLETNPPPPPATDAAMRERIQKELDQVRL